jgi:GTP pyrophosphokinase
MPIERVMLLQIHRELVQSQAGISEALHQKFLAMLLAMEDVPAVLIVLADHLHLMRSKPTSEAAHDALDVFAPLANRLGVWSIKAELEDLSFKVTSCHVSCLALCTY